MAQLINDPKMGGGGGWGQAQNIKILAERGGGETAPWMWGLIWDGGGGDAGGPLSRITWKIKGFSQFTNSIIQLIYYDHQITIHREINGFSRFRLVKWPSNHFSITPHPPPPPPYMNHIHIHIHCVVLFLPIYAQCT